MKDELTFIQKKLLNAFDKFISYCDKHKLTWFADGGTLLGVVRNGRLIPWDDDIDVIMPREDFDRLSKMMHAKSGRFAYGLFFQDPVTDPEYFNIHARLRLDGTSNASKREQNIDSHKGYFIDIYPLDNIYDDFVKNYDVARYLRELAKLTDVEADIHAIEKQTKPNEAYVAMQKFLGLMNESCESTLLKLVFPACFWRYSKYRGMMMKKEWYETYTKYPMKDLRHHVNVPGGFENILTLWYGKTWFIPQKEASFHGK